MGNNEVTLNISNVATYTNVKAKFKVEDPRLLNTIFGDIQENTITQEQLRELEKIASRSGNEQTLEVADLTNEQKFSHFEFNKYYDIRVEGENYIVKIKDAGFFIKNPTADTIKNDFGLKDNVLYSVFNPDNDKLFEERETSSFDGATHYDTTKFKVGDEITIPIKEVNITDSPRGFWGRLNQFE